MFNYIWPIALVVLANTLYQLCSKSTPADINPFASLTVTYFIAMVTAVVFYFLLGKHTSLLHEYTKLNWAPFVLGISIVGLEVGFIYAYKAGWQVSTASSVQNAFLAIALILCGMLFFKEALTWNKVVGVVICIVGLIFINYK